jgi:signal transduction histidine kinase
MRNRSLALRLFLASAGWGLVLIVVAGVLLAGIFRQSVERNFDGRLNAYLQALIAGADWSDAGEIRDVGSVGEPRFETLFSGWYWQITEPGVAGPGLYASRSLSLERLDVPSARGEAPDALGFLESYGKGPRNENLRILERRITFSGSDRVYFFAVAGDSAEIDQEVAAFRKNVFWALGVLTVALAAITLFQVRYGLRPLQAISRQLNAIRSGKAKRLSGDFPSEIDSLANELNALIDSNAAIVERARTHVGNLAHGLKTPLSVISNETDKSNSPLARKVAEQLSIIRDQITRHLDRARMAARANVIGVTTPVQPVLQALVRTMEKIHHERALAISLNCPADVIFAGEQQDLEEIAGNLLDNACKWAAARIAVAVEPARGGEKLLRLVIEDDGPGLTAPQRSEVLERGARADENTPGSGLGLSIVSEIVSLYEGNLRLSASSSGGLKVEVDLPSVGEYV